MEDGSRYQELRFTGLASGTAQVTLASTAFDAFISVERVNPDGTFEVIAEDDDAGGGTNALVTVAVVPGTQYKAIVTGTGSSSSGAFQGTYSGSLLVKN
jgi:hypothetical protein